MTKISIRLLLYAIALALIFLSGCGLAQRQALMRDKYPYYPEHVKRAIDGGYIVEGMEQEQVYLDSYNLNLRDYLSDFKFQIFLASFRCNSL